MAPLSEGIQAPETISDIGQVKGMFTKRSQESEFDKEKGIIKQFEEHEREQPNVIMMELQSDSCLSPNFMEPLSTDNEHHKVTANQVQDENELNEKSLAQQNSD